MENPSFSKITSMHFYAWKNGLKTGQYYLRTKAAADAIKFTVNVESLLKAVDEKDAEKMMKYISTGEEKKKGTRKMVRRKRVQGEPKSAPKGEEKPKVAPEDMVCPLRRPDEDGPCDMCSG